jgi:hypothetical protein
MLNAAALNQSRTALSFGAREHAPADNSAGQLLRRSLNPLELPSRRRDAMPIFDESTSKASRAELDLLRSVLGPGKRRRSLQSSHSAYRPARKRAQLKRGLVVLALIAGVCGSALLTSRNSTSPVAEARATSSDRDPVSTGSVSVKVEGCLKSPSSAASAIAEAAAKSASCP